MLAAFFSKFLFALKNLLFTPVGIYSYFVVYACVIRDIKTCRKRQRIIIFNNELSVKALTYIFKLCVIQISLDTLTHIFYSNSSEGNGGGGGDGSGGGPC